MHLEMFNSREKQKPIYTRNFMLRMLNGYETSTCSEHFFLLLMSYKLNRFNNKLLTSFLMAS